MAAVTRPGSMDLDMSVLWDVLGHGQEPRGTDTPWKRPVLCTIPTGPQKELRDRDGGI